MTRDDRTGETPVDTGPPEGFHAWLKPEAVAERARRGALPVERKDEWMPRKPRRATREWKL